MCRRGSRSRCAAAEARRSDAVDSVAVAQSSIWRCWRAPTRRQAGRPARGSSSGPSTAGPASQLIRVGQRHRRPLLPLARRPGRDRARRGARATRAAGRKSPRISLDRPVRGTHGPHDDGNRRAVGRRASRRRRPGVGVATIDSGVNAWHDDLDGRVVHFADFVNVQPFAVRRLRPRHARRRHHRRQRLRLERRRARASRLARTSSCSRCSTSPATGS